MVGNILSLANYIFLPQTMMVTPEVYSSKGHYEIQSSQDSTMSTAVKWPKVFIKALCPYSFLYGFLIQGVASAAVPATRQSVVDSVVHGLLSCSSDHQRPLLWRGSGFWVLPFCELRLCDVRSQNDHLYWTILIGPPIIYQGWGEVSNYFNLAIIL